MILFTLIIITETGNDSREFQYKIEVSNKCKMEKITVIATAYTADYKSTGKTKGHPLYRVTASGATATNLYTIAMDNSIPFGTQVFIPYFKDKYNKGWFKVQDRGGAIKLHRKPKGVHKVDIFMDDYREAKKFGRREIDIYIMHDQGGLCL